MLESSWNAEATALGYASEREMLTDLYYEHGFSLKQIGQILNSCTWSVRKRLLSLGQPLRARGGPNRRGKRSLKHLTNDELMNTPPPQLAIEQGVHIGTIFAEKRLRAKEKVIV